MPAIVRRQVFQSPFESEHVVDHEIPHGEQLDPDPVRRDFAGRREAGVFFARRSVYGRG